jgi:3-deoxy-D-manno-octulosonic-acid transferase
MGELINAYAISDVVILGGALAKVGGHNAAEAAQFGCRIISGPNYFNQKDIYKSIDAIEIAQDYELDTLLLNYRDLKPTKIDTNAKIDELLEDIKSVL